MKIELSTPVWDAINFFNRVLTEIHLGISASALPRVFIPQTIEIDLEDPGIFKFWSDGVAVKVITHMSQGRLRVDYVSITLKAGDGSEAKLEFNPRLLLSPASERDKCAALNRIKSILEH